MLTVQCTCRKFGQDCHIVCRCRESNVADVDCTVEEANVGTARKTVHITYMFLVSTTAPLLDVPARQATQAGGIDSLDPIPEPVFVDLLRRPGIDSQPGGPVRNPICRTGPPGYIGWQNRFLGIDSWAP